MDRPSLSVVGFVDEQNTAHLHVQVSQKNATTEEFQSANRVSSDQQAGHVTHRTSDSKNSLQGLSQQLSNLQIGRAPKRNTLINRGNVQ